MAPTPLPKRPQIRITSDGTRGNSHVVLVDEAGTETDLSRFVTVAEWRLDAAEGRARCHLAVHPEAVDLVGDLADVTVNDLGQWGSGKWGAE
jgi:hypothetical protein